ncbi:hypothetical protein ILYODFUR_016729, partial [Ilyodon furcidens]
CKSTIGTEKDPWHYAATTMLKSWWLWGCQEWWQVFHVPLIIPGGYLRWLPPAVQRQSVALSDWITIPNLTFEES